LTFLYSKIYNFIFFKLSLFWMFIGVRLQFIHPSNFSNFCSLEEIHYSPNISVESKTRINSVFSTACACHITHRSVFFGPPTMRTIMPADPFFQYYVLVFSLPFGFRHTCLPIGPCQFQDSTALVLLDADSVVKGDCMAEQGAWLRGTLVQENEHLNT
jgi:hypothetical protein